MLLARRHAWYTQHAIQQTPVLGVSNTAHNNKICFNRDLYYTVIAYFNVGIFIYFHVFLGLKCEELCMQVNGEMNRDLQGKNHFRIPFHIYQICQTRILLSAYYFHSRQFHKQRRSWNHLLVHTVFNFQEANMVTPFQFMVLQQNFNKNLDWACT